MALLSPACYLFILRLKFNDPVKSTTWVQDITKPQIQTKKKHSFVKISNSTDDEMFAKDLINPTNDTKTMLSMTSIAQRLKQI